jgi:hypothetical protein
LRLGLWFARVAALWAIPLLVVERFGTRRGMYNVLGGFAIAALIHWDDVITLFV